MMRGRSVGLRFFSCLRSRLRLAPLLLLALSLAPQRAGAADYNFAGSVSLNYKSLVNELSDPKVERSLVLSGFNINAALKAVVDVNPYLSASVKVCYGCHGFEAAYFIAELTPHPAINVRAGRIMPAFGDFYLRHDPTSHKTPDNPLPYDMGHMVHSREWNMSIMPIPYVDTGVEAYGTLRPTPYLSIAYAAHVVNGFKGPGPSESSSPVHDFDYQRMRFVTSPDYMVDNNRRPSIGGRVALTFSRTDRMSPRVPDVTLGGSATWGTYDDADKLDYLIYGIDFYMRLWRVNLRAEALRRQQDVDPRLLDYNTPKPMTTGTLNMNLPAVQTQKSGFYLETDFPLGNYLEGVLRFDGMSRSGPRDARTDPDQANLPPAERTYVAPATAVLDFNDWILRYTVGLNIIPITGAKIKLSYEYWTFKDVAGDTYRADYSPPFHDEYEIHVALVSSF